MDTVTTKVHTTGLLHERDELPTGLLDCPARELHTLLGGPTLIHLEGRRAEPLFVSVLLHGNEDTGLLAIQRLLRRHGDQTLPRALSIFFGNISAARLGVRRLDGQPDYNRVWPGGEAQDTPEAAMMRQLVDIMGRRRVFASVDIHNNTGLNPHYACINQLDHRFLQLATLFSHTVVYFLRPRGVQSMAFARLCPAVTLECGKPAEPHGLEHATSYLTACIHLSEIPRHPVADSDIHLFHTVAQVKVRPGIHFSFQDDDVDLRFTEDLDRFNFRELPPDTEFGQVRRAGLMPLIAVSETGVDVTDRYFAIDHRRLILIRSAMPSMLTLDEQVIRQDCLCYLMERMDPARA